MESQTQQILKGKCLQGEKKNLGKHTVKKDCHFNQGCRRMEEKSKIEEKHTGLLWELVIESPALHFKKYLLNLHFAF